MSSNWLYYSVLVLAIAGYIFATGYWIAQDRAAKRIRYLEGQLGAARKLIAEWRFPHAPDSD